MTSLEEYHRFALVGDPVEHSLSPLIQEAALELAGLSGEYRAITADFQVLDEVLDDLRSGRLNGVNVTMPLKLAALERSDRLTDLATRSGSVNTLRARGPLIEAHSTDAAAFELILARMPGVERILVLGAGGSARAALGAWGAREGAYITARDTSKAAALEVGSVVPWSRPVDGALVINATPLGMRGEELPSGILDSAVGLIDLPYASGMTPAVARARRGRVPVIDGIEFLAIQAAASFEWWTGVAVDSARLALIARNG